MKEINEGVWEHRGYEVRATGIPFAKYEIRFEGMFVSFADTRTESKQIIEENIDECTLNPNEDEEKDY